uniref:Uncharacterized protein n=1 Tax=Oryza brachyantha TaxID=4533 RepID=J3MRJ1_ORYBR
AWKTRENKLTSGGQRTRPQAGCGGGLWCESWIVSAKEEDSGLKKVEINVNVSFVKTLLGLSSRFGSFLLVAMGCLKTSFLDVELSQPLRSLTNGLLVQ